MTSLASVPAVGINTDFIRDQPLELTIDSGMMGTTDTISYGDGTPFMVVKHDLMSASHRIHFVDSRSDQMLFEMMKETFHSEYYAERPDGSGQHLFDIDIEAAFMGGPTAYVDFGNVANGGNTVRFEYKTHTFDEVNIVLWDGQPIAEVDRRTLSRTCSVRIAPLVDPLPIIAMLMALTDRARRKKRRNHGVGGAGAI